MSPLIPIIGTYPALKMAYAGEGDRQRWFVAGRCEFRLQSLTLALILGAQEKKAPHSMTGRGREMASLRPPFSGRSARGVY